MISKISKTSKNFKTASLQIHYIKNVQTFPDNIDFLIFS